MIPLALALALLATPAEAATAVDRMHCWAYPRHERCRPPAPPEPVQAPVVPPPPVVAPAPPAPQATPEPLQAPLPTVAPVQLPAAPAPPVAAPAPARAAPAPRAAPVKKAKPVKAKKRETRPKRAAVKASKREAKTKHKKTAADSGPDLPWPCWMVRMNAQGKTCADMRAEGKRRGISLSPKQLRQAATCIGRCF